jgi:hypothetical protein
MALNTTLLPYYLTNLLPYYLTTLLPYYLISEVASIVDVSTLTIKRWESGGKIPKAMRSGNNWRMYSEPEIEKIKKFSQELIYPKK